MLVLKVVNTETFPGTWNLTENISKSQQHKKNGIYNEYNRIIIIQSQLSFSVV